MEQMLLVSPVNVYEIITILFYTIIFDRPREAEQVGDPMINFAIYCV